MTLETMWQQIAQLVWLTRPEWVRDMPLPLQLVWYRRVLKELAQEIVK